jgi:hypothetical protein
MQELEKSFEQESKDSVTSNSQASKQTRKHFGTESMDQMTPLANHKNMATHKKEMG